MGTQVRVLVATVIDGTTYPPNTVLDLPKAIAGTYAAVGAVDPEPAAVAYCIDELKAVPIAVDPSPEAKAAARRAAETKAAADTADAAAAAAEAAKAADEAKAAAEATAAAAAAKAPPAA